MSEKLKIHIQDCNSKPEVKIVNIEGTLDMLAPPVLEKTIPPLIEQGYNIVFDCRNLEYVNSRGLVAFLEYSAKLKGKGKSFKVCNINKSVYETMDISGALKLLDIYDSLKDAIESIK